MTTPRQPLLRMPIAADVALIPLITVGALLGLHRDGVEELVDQGEWPWVFDLRAGKGTIRELRVWRGCFGKSEVGSRKSEFTGVVADVIGTTTGDVRGAMLETRWQVSNQTLRRLLHNGDIRGRMTGHTLWLERESLAEFLGRRRS